MVERLACPKCEAPVGGACRTRAGKVAANYHAARFMLVPALCEELAAPSDRGPGWTWKHGLPVVSAAPLAKTAPVRSGYVRCGTEPRSWPVGSTRSRPRTAPGCSPGRSAPAQGPSRVRQRPRLGSRDSLNEGSGFGGATFNGTAVFDGAIRKGLAFNPTMQDASPPDEVPKGCRPKNQSREPLGERRGHHHFGQRGSTRSPAASWWQQGLQHAAPACSRSHSPCWSLFHACTWARTTPTTYLPGLFSAPWSRAWASRCGGR